MIIEKKKAAIRDARIEDDSTGMTPKLRDGYHLPPPPGHKASIVLSETCQECDVPNADNDRQGTNDTATTVKNVH